MRVGGFPTKKARHITTHATVRNSSLFLLSDDQELLLLPSSSSSRFFLSSGGRQSLFSFLLTAAYIRCIFTKHQAADWEEQGAGLPTVTRSNSHILTHIYSKREWSIGGKMVGPPCYQLNTSLCPRELKK